MMGGTTSLRGLSEMRAHITFVLDSSGSMQAIKEDTIGGFNAFLDDQRQEDGEASVSLFNFDTRIEEIYHGEPLDTAPELQADTYQPSGRTALHDAIATAIDETDAYLQGLDDPVDTVIVAVLTDGKENSSETPADTVKELVEARQENEDWEFLFIGAKQDAALSAQTVGIEADHALTMDHSDEGVRAAYEATSKSVSRARQTGQSGGYDDEDRRRQQDS